MLYNAVDESSRADGSRYGGVRGYWLAEGGTKTASAPTFRQMELKLKKVAALCYATDELLADATALESWLGRTVPEELRFQVESAFYRGNGVGKPLGIMNSPCLVSVTRIDANQVDQTDIANMWARRWQGVDDYVWLSNASVFPQLINLTVGNFPFLLPMSAGGQGDPAFSLYGKPYIESEYTYALGTTGDIMLASLSQYQTITKGGVQAASSIHVQFTTDETAFRFVYRTDGQPLWNSALTPYDAGSTLSPFVVLTAASV
jgi:HK97 family phage major capsid protein